MFLMNEMSDRLTMELEIPCCSTYISVDFGGTP
jgi:hypothetical protein